MDVRKKILLVLLFFSYLDCSKFLLCQDTFYLAFANKWLNVGLLKIGLLFFLVNLFNFAYLSWQSILFKKIHNQTYFKRQEPRLAVESQLWLETLLWKLLFKFPGLALNCWKMTIHVLFSNSRKDYLVTYSSKTDNNPTLSPVQLTDCGMFLKTYFCWMESRYLKGLVNVKQRLSVF